MTQVLLAANHNLEVLRKRAEGLKSGYRQNIAIIGDESIGKTTLLLNFLNTCTDGRIIPVYMDIRREPFEYLIKRFIGALLYSFLKTSNISLKEDLPYLIAKSQKYIPRTIAAITTLLKHPGAKKEAQLNALLDLCEIIHAETSKSCIVIFDEFLHLEHAGIRNLYKTWSKILISHKATMYIITSSAVCKAKHILASHLSLLFGNFELLEIGPLDIHTSNEFILGLLKPYSLGRPYRDFLVHFTGGHPYYLKIISQELLKASARNTHQYSISEDTLLQMLKETLFDELGVLNLRFQGSLKRLMHEGLDQEYIRILHLIASGRNKTKDIAHGLRKQIQGIQPKISRLIELDCIRNNGDFFIISDRLFGFWLTSVYQEKMMVFTHESRERVDLFKKNITEMIHGFVHDAKRPVSARIMELMESFGNEAILVENKRFKLAQFREIKPLRFSGKGFREGILGRSCDDLWIIAFKDGAVTEDDVADFSLECKKYKHNRHPRRIIVAPAAIEENAKLKAMEEKILTWDLGNINSILDLYSKPRIIV